MSLSSPSLEVERFGCFGKLPVSREFIVEGTRDLTESGFDRWIGGGVGLAKARLGSRFNERISAFPRYRFLWDGGRDRMLAGVICPSHDAAGRKHPFALFAFLRGRRRSALSAALQVLSLQERTGALLDSVSSTEASQDLRDTLRSAQQESPLQGHSIEERYHRFLEERPGDGFCGDLKGRFTVLQALVETLEPLQKGTARAFRGGIRYPLSKRSSTDTAWESCFWLDLTERYLGRALGSSWWLRSPGGPEEDCPYFFLFLSTPSPSQWISLVDPGDALESISYLDRPYGADPPEKKMDPSLRAILESQGSSFGDYLRWAKGP